MFRIQKILLADYPEIYEPVLVENPFAEVTDGGLGIRQVQLGLTPTKIIIGIDVFKKDSLIDCCLLDVTRVSVAKDPEIECFDLVAVLPLELLKVSFFKKNNRSIMDVRIAGEKNMLFEFGGYLSQNLFWNTWRERIATLKLTGSNLFNLTASSPFSSSDIIADEEEVTACIHLPPRRQSLSSDNESGKFPLRALSHFNEPYASKYEDIIEKTSSTYLSDSEQQHQMELHNYYQALFKTNSLSCGHNTSW